MSLELTCDREDIVLPVVTADAREAAEQLRLMMERHLPLDAPPSRRRLVVRLLGLILDDHKVPVTACEWKGWVDDLDTTKWRYVGRTRIAWTCPRCGADHEEELHP